MAELWPAGEEPALLELHSVLVVGGCGFLGHHIVKALLEHPEKPIVSVFDADISHNLHEGVAYFKGDITSPSDVKLFLDLAKPRVIIHTASIISDHESYIPDDLSKFIKVNIMGTVNLLEQAKTCPSVAAFVYTSSAAILEQEASFMADETAKVTTKIDKFEPYAGTKARAEYLVLEANNQNSHDNEGLRTCSLRLAGVHGPGDPHLLGPALEKIPLKQTGIQLGTGDALSDFTFVGNAAHAHILASKALLVASEGSQDQEKVDGEAFFITDDDPMSFWEFSRRVWAVAGYHQKPEEVRIIPIWLIMAIAATVGWAFWIVTFGRRRPKTLRRCLLAWCCFSRTFDISKAKERLGYEPKFTTAEALKIGVENVESGREAAPGANSIGGVEKKRE